MRSCAQPEPHAGAIQRWIVPILGFTQSTARPTGLEAVWSLLRSLSEPGTCIVTPRVWDDDWPATARFIARNSTAEPRIDIVAYSWGAGWGFVQLASALNQLADNRGRPAPLHIHRAVLADPVYRNPRTPAWLIVNVRSMFNRFWAPTITIPPNVYEVWATRQYTTKPAGHDLRVANRWTRLHKPIVRDLSHNQMDSDPVFHRLTLEALGVEPCCTDASTPPVT